MIDYKKIQVSEDNTHFLFKEKLMFNKKYNEVLKFHAPGIAPVKDRVGWYHINLLGDKIYAEIYQRTFGYYCNRATVVDFKNNWFHINTKGIRIYKENFAWCGNYQENICTVRGFDNFYFHIDEKGNKIYHEKYKYAGDFKDGFAVVRLQNGLCKHINKQGNDLNDKLFIDLGVFHKNYATAKDQKGWFHINKNGIQLYTNRYKTIEPFYNGFALVENFENNKQIIDEKGEIIIKL